LQASQRWIRERLAKLSAWDRRFATGILLLVSVVVFVVALRGVWYQGGYRNDLFGEGYFLHLRDGVGLHVRSNTAASATVLFGVDEQTVWASPGRVLVFPLRPGSRYRISVPGRSRAPYLVFGSSEPQPAALSQPGPRFTPGNSPRSNPANPGKGQRSPRLADPKTLTIEGGAPKLRSWQPTRPWRVDRQWLRALQARCGSNQKSLSIVVASGFKDVEIRAGQCRLSYPVQRAVGRQPLLAVVSGPGWAAVDRVDRAWPIDWKVSTPVLATVIVVALLGLGTLWVAFDLAAPLLLVLAMLLCSAWRLDLSVLLGVAGLLVGLGSAGVWGGRRLWRYRWWAALLGGAGCLVLVAPVVYLTLLVRNMQPSGARKDHTRTPPTRCRVVGYSNVAGEGVRADSYKLAALINAQCAPCQGATLRQAWPGGTFRQARAHLCRARSNAAPPPPTIFMGGTNDDLLWAFWRRGTIPKIRMLWRVLSWKMQRRLSPPQVQALFHAAAQNSLKGEPRQRRLLRETVRCVRRQGAPFWYFHNFYAFDLEGGRSTTRKKLITMRQRAVQSTGGRFVNLLEALGSEAGVSWFSDFIHFSAVGHQRVARFICQHLQGAKPRQTGAGSTSRKSVP